MDYIIEIDNFEGPLDLLLHLVKKSEVDIFDISIVDITQQYLEYINLMESMNLNVASEYLTLAAELIEIKSSILLPKKKIDEESLYEDDPKQNLINRLIEYEKYKKVTNILKEYEKERKEIYTKSPTDLETFNNDTNIVDETFDLKDLMNAINKMLDRKRIDMPLNTKITNKEYSIIERSNEIKNILIKKSKLNFTELFEIPTKNYVVVTFLSILNMARHNELNIIQNKNFDDIIIERV